MDAVPGKSKVGDGKLDISGVEALVDSREEWKQIFREAWRIERDFYYDPAMGGKDWAAIGKRYEALLPWVASRRQFPETRPSSPARLRPSSRHG